MVIKIRKASLKDFGEIAELAKETIEFHSKYEPELYNYKNSGKFYSKHLKDAIKDKDILFFVAQDGEKICGYIYGLASAWYPGYLIGNIIDLIVGKNHRGKGMGKALLEKMILSLKKKGCKQVEIQVEVENKNALGLYESLGFRKWKYHLKKRL